MPSADELFYAVAALDCLSTITTSDLRRLGLDPLVLTRGPQMAETDHQRWRRALAIDPKVYLGETNDPKSPECQRRRAVAKRLVAKLNDSCSG